MTNAVRETPRPRVVLEANADRLAQTSGTLGNPWHAGCVGPRGERSLVRKVFMTAPNPVVPGSNVFNTRRTLDGIFHLRPDAEVNQRIEFAPGYAAGKHNIDLYSSFRNQRLFEQHEESSSALILQRENEAFYDGDAADLAEITEAMLDLFSFAPRPTNWAPLSVMIQSGILLARAIVARGMGEPKRKWA